MATPFSKPFDPTTSEGYALWKMAVKPLPTPFDGSQGTANAFIADLSGRFTLCCWYELITFNISGTNYDLITNHALISLAQVTGRMDAACNLAATAAPVPIPDATTGAVTNQAAIDAHKLAVDRVNKSNMMYQFLFGSIDGPLRTHIAAKITQGLVKQDGVILLKYIRLKMVGTATKQAVRDARYSLQSLNFKAYNFDVHKMHDHVNAASLLISSNGETRSEDDLVTALLNAYKQAPNQEFCQLISSIENNAEKDGDEIKAEDLMHQAAVCYDKHVKRKKWTKSDPHDQQIMALKASIDKLTAAAAKSATDKKTKPDSKKTDKDKDKDKNKAKKKNDKPRSYPDWMIKAPSNGQTTMTRKVKDKQVKYHWCPPHRDGKGLWVQHTKEECSLLKQKNEDSTPRLQANLSAIFSDAESDGF